MLRINVNIVLNLDANVFWLRSSDDGVRKCLQVVFSLSLAVLSLFFNATCLRLICLELSFGMDAEVKHQPLCAVWWEVTHVSSPD